MLTIAGFGDTLAVEREDAQQQTYTAILDPAFYALMQEPMMFYQAQVFTPKPGDCVPPDVKGEFGCLTPIIETGRTGANYPVYGCPVGSEPYSATHCLRTSNVEAERAAAAAIAAAQAAAEAQAAADRAAVIAAAEQASAAAKAAADAEAARQQQYADMVAAAAKQAADAAVAAYAAAHPDGSAPSPGMTVTPTSDPTIPTWSVADERKRWYKWGAIGAGVVGLGLFVLLARRDR